MKATASAPGNGSKFGTRWTRDETILALDLYFRLAPGQKTSRNAEVVGLAKLIGRTPGSVALKLCNLESFNPKRTALGLSGMKNGSLLDREIFTEFSGDLESLAMAAYSIRARLRPDDPAVAAVEAGLGQIPPGTYRERLVKERVGQGFFRQALLNDYENHCCVTGLCMPEMLVASHIKPWSKSEAFERADPRNGLCLNALHDKAFDRGLITIESIGGGFEVIVGRSLSEAEMDPRTKQWLMSYEHRKIQLPLRFPPKVDFVKYHNEHVFRG